MIAFACVKLTGCTTDEVIYVSAGIFPQSTTSYVSPSYYFWSALDGNVVTVSSTDTYTTLAGDTVTFSDIGYTVTLYDQFGCLPGDPCFDCLENRIRFNQNGVIVNDDDFTQYVTDTGETTCPEPSFTAYVLVNCRIDPSTLPENPEDITQSYLTALVTSTNLSFYVGSVVNIVEYPDNCYLVLGPYAENTGCPCDEYRVTQSFEDCACCTPDPEPLDCCEIPKNRQNPVNNYFRVVDSDCDIEVNKKFANNYYRLFTTIRYGIENCCRDVDMEKLWIQKEIADYEKIKFGESASNPPTLCLYVIGSSRCGSQTAEYNGIINGKWSWLFTREDETVGIIYWDNVNSRWICADNETNEIAAILEQNTDYPIGDTDFWISVSGQACLSPQTGLSTLTISCDCD